MFEKLQIVRMAQALAGHAGARQGEIARNIANADTPGYRARDMPDFAAAYTEGGGLRQSRPGHLESGSTYRGAAEIRATKGAASPDGNTVSLETEMLKAAEVRQQHDMALAIYRSTSRILRLSLGRQG